MRRLSFALAVAAVLALVGPASAISLGGYTGDIRMKFDDLDTGVLYGPFVDMGGAPVAFGPVVGEAALNALPQTPAPGVVGIEDSWGIARLTEIFDADGNTLWSHLGGVNNPLGNDVVGIFWGERDTYFEQTIVGGFPQQSIHGVGFKIAFWEVPDGVVIPSTYTTADRTAEDLVTGFNDQVGADLIWTLNSIPGSNLAFPTDEFFTTFFPAGGGPNGLNAFGSMQADVGTINRLGGGTLTGSQNDFFALSASPHWDIQFTGVAPSSVNTGFLVLSDDPILANVAIPEPATMTGLLLGLGALFGYRRKRNRK